MGELQGVGSNSPTAILFSSSAGKPLNPEWTWQAAFQGNGSTLRSAEAEWCPSSSLGAEMPLRSLSTRPSNTLSSPTNEGGEQSVEQKPSDAVDAESKDGSAVSRPAVASAVANLFRIDESEPRWQEWLQLSDSITPTVSGGWEESMRRLSE